MPVSRTILLVEDEPTLQRILGSVLTDAGHTVESVGTAEQALERLADTGRPEIDLVLSDKNLPAMNGLDLLAELRKQEHESDLLRGFVLVTGYPSRESAVRVLQDGGDGYLVKPFRSLVHAMNRVQGVLESPLAARRSAAARAHALADVLMGSGAAPENTRATVLIDDEALHLRCEQALSAAGVKVVPAESPGDEDRALIAARVEDLGAFRADRPQAALVLVDAGASFQDLLELIWAGGAHLVDPVAVVVP